MKNPPENLVVLSHTAWFSFVIHISAFIFTLTGTLPSDEPEFDRIGYKQCHQWLACKIICGTILVCVAQCRDLWFKGTAVFLVKSWAVPLMTRTQDRKCESAEYASKTICSKSTQLHLRQLNTPASTRNNQEEINFGRGGTERMVQSNYRLWGDDFTEQRLTLGWLFFFTSGSGVCNDCRKVCCVLIKRMTPTL